MHALITYLSRKEQHKVHVFALQGQTKLCEEDDKIRGWFPSLMMVSIRAGFRNGELRELLDLGNEWEWKEEVSLLGGLRVLAWRK